MRSTSILEPLRAYSAPLKMYVSVVTREAVGQFDRSHSTDRFSIHASLVSALSPDNSEVERKSSTTGQATVNVLSNKTF
jgi:hypothetical protein